MTVALLMSVHPALALLAVFALPTVLASAWRPGVERTAQERGAPANRLARHLFVTATTAAPGKEVRVAGIGDRLVARPPRGLGTLVRARGRGPLGQRRLAYARVGHLRCRVRRRRSCSSPLVAPCLCREVLLVLAAGSRLSAYIGATVGEIGFLRGIWLDGSVRLAWLEDYAAALGEHSDAAGARAALGRASASSTSPSSIRGRSVACSRMSAWT